MRATIVCNVWVTVYNWNSVVILVSFDSHAHPVKTHMVVIVLMLL